MPRRDIVVRGIVVLALIGGLTAALVASPVGAAQQLTRKKVKKIASQVFNSKIGGAMRVDGNVSDSLIDDFTAAAYTSILSTSVTAPAAGHLLIVGSASFLDANGVSDGCLGIRLRLDAMPVTDAGIGYLECASGVGDYGAVSASAVVPVTAGSHTVHLDGREFATGSDIFGRDISVLFVLEGSGATIPV